jgi:hypothetical protein
MAFFEIDLIFVFPWYAVMSRLSMRRDVAVIYGWLECGYIEELSTLPSIAFARF